MIDLGKHNLLGVMVNAIDYEASVDRIVWAAQDKAPCAVAALAVHGLMNGALDKTHRYRLNDMNLVVPDGQPVRWALDRLYSTNLADRVYGPSLMLKTCQRAAALGLPIYLFGGDASLIERLSSVVRRQFSDLQIAGSEPSKF